MFIYKKAPYKIFALNPNFVGPALPQMSSRHEDSSNKSSNLSLAGIDKLIKTNNETPRLNQKL